MRHRGKQVSSPIRSLNELRSSIEGCDEGVGIYCNSYKNKAVGRVADTYTFLGRCRMQHQRKPAEMLLSWNELEMTLRRGIMCPTKTNEKMAQKLEEWVTSIREIRESIQPC